MWSAQTRPFSLCAGSKALNRHVCSMMLCSCLTSMECAPLTNTAPETCPAALPHRTFRNLCGVRYTQGCGL